MVKDGSQRKGLPGGLVTEDAEVVGVAVDVENQGIQQDHSAGSCPLWQETGAGGADYSSQRPLFCTQAPQLVRNSECPM